MSSTDLGLSDPSVISPQLFDVYEPTTFQKDSWHFQDLSTTDSWSVSEPPFSSLPLHSTGLESVFTYQDLEQDGLFTAGSPAAPERQLDGRVRQYSTSSSFGGSCSSTLTSFSPHSTLSTRRSSTEEDYAVEFEAEETSCHERRGRRRTANPDKKLAKKLEKNRQAAEKCRQKQRVYVADLQRRASVEEEKRQKLIQEVKNLKSTILQMKEEMVTHSGCKDERIRQYLLQEVDRKLEYQRPKKLSEGAGGHQKQKMFE